MPPPSTSGQTSLVTRTTCTAWTLERGARRRGSPCVARMARTMAERRVLVTGGAGFVGANLAVALAARHPGWEVVALDNLNRRGAELNLPRLREAGVAFE